MSNKRKKTSAPTPPPPLPPAALEADVLFSQEDLLKRGNVAGIEALEKAAAAGSPSAKASLERARRERPELFNEAAGTGQGSDLPPPKAGERRLILSSEGPVAFQGFDNLMEMIGFVEVFCDPQMLIANLKREWAARVQQGRGQ